MARAARAIGIVPGMTTGRRSVALALSGLLTLGIVLTSGVARAETTLVARSVDRQRLMGVADVPRVLGRFSPESVSRQVDPIITLCQDANSELVTIPAPMRLTTVTINSVPGARLYRSVAEDVYQYPNGQAAASAFTSLTQSASACSGTTTRRDGQGGYTEQVRLATGSVDGASPAAIWTRQQTMYLRAPADSPLNGHRDILYRVFTQAGNAIIVTTYAINGASSLRAGQAAAVQRLALSNAARWTTP